MSTEVDGEEKKRKQNDARNRAVFILFAAYLKLCGMINGTQGGGSTCLANSSLILAPQTVIQPIIAHPKPSVPRYRPRCTNQRHPAKYSQRSILLF